MPTPWTAETLWPAQGEQIVAASLLARKVRLEFELVARVILHQALHYILGSPESSGYPASLIVVSSIASAAPLELRQSGFEPNAKGEPIRWTTWAARPEIAPRTFVAHDSSRSRGDAGSLAVAAEGNPAAYGGWEGLVADIQPEKWYRFSAHYQAEGLTDESLQFVARLDWSEASGKRAGRPDYAYTVTDEGGWRRVRLEAPAPAEAAAVKIQLFLFHSANGRVWWDEVSLAPIETPSPRLVRVASVNLQPRKTGSREVSVGRFLDVVESRVPEEADIILLPEGITVVGTGKSYSEVAEPIPGPTTRALAEAARAKKAYLAAGIYERDGQAIYNTAVLLDRQGEVVGKYRKVYLPREEIEGGLAARGESMVSCQVCLIPLHVAVGRAGGHGMPCPYVAIRAVLGFATGC